MSSAWPEDVAVSAGGLAGGFDVVQTEGSASATSHLPFVRQYIRARWEDGRDADAIVAAVDALVESSSSSRGRR